MEVWAAGNKNSRRVTCLSFVFLEHCCVNHPLGPNAILCQNKSCSRRDLCRWPGTIPNVAAEISEPERLSQHLFLNLPFIRMQGGGEVLRLLRWESVGHLRVRTLGEWEYSGHWVIRSFKRQAGEKVVFPTTDSLYSQLNALSLRWLNHTTGCNHTPLCPCPSLCWFLLLLVSDALCLPLSFQVSLSICPHYGYVLSLHHIPPPLHPPNKDLIDSES